MILTLSTYGLLFFFYSFLGWLMESLKGFVETKKFVNRGVLIGPICPIYGVGAIVMVLLLRKYANDYITLFVLAFVICSLLEYFTSYILEKIFKLRWWDYSDRKYNIEGRICLTNLIAFGILAVLMIVFIHPVIINFIHTFSNHIVIISFIILFVLFLTDIVASFQIILGIVDVAMNVKKDSTEEVTKKVRSILTKRGGLYARIVHSFNIEATERMMAEISEKLKTKAKETHHKLEKEKIKKQEEAKVIRKEYKRKKEEIKKKIER